MPKGKLKWYKFDVGNSNEGALGMVIRVWARSKPSAVKKANAYLEEKQFVKVSNTRLDLGLDYCTVYFGANLTIKDIADAETEDAGPKTAKALAMSGQ